MGAGGHPQWNTTIRRCSPSILSPHVEDKDTGKKNIVLEAQKVLSLALL